MSDHQYKLPKMTVRPFMAVLPKQTQVGDEVILKGKIKNNADV